MLSSTAKLISAGVLDQISGTACPLIRSVNRCSNIGASTATVECWDYSRLIDVDGVEAEEFVFVEMNKMVIEKLRAKAIAARSSATKQ